VKKNCKHGGKKFSAPGYSHSNDQKYWCERFESALAECLLQHDNRFLQRLLCAECSLTDLAYVATFLCDRCGFMNGFSDMSISEVSATALPYFF
jgi:hypothetical protein